MPGSDAVSLLTEREETRLSLGEGERDRREGGRERKRGRDGGTGREIGRARERSVGGGVEERRREAGWVWEGKREVWSNNGPLVEDGLAGSVATLLRIEEVLARDELKRHARRAPDVRLPCRV
jgi:hypothetical protein